MFGDILKELREDKGLTQEDLATLMNIGRTSITSYETNSSQPSIETLIKLADYFNVSTDYLLCRTKNYSNNKVYIIELKNTLNKILDEYILIKK